MKIRLCWLIIILFLNQTSLAAQKLTFQIEGIDGAAKNNVEATLKNSFVSSNGTLDLKQFYRDSSEKIQKALQPFGYFKSKIYSTFIVNHGQSIISFRIEPGPPLLIKHLDFQLTGIGASDQAFQYIMQNLPLAKNQIFSAQKYNLLKQELENVALQHGYFDAHFSQAQIKIDLPKYEVTIILHFTTGQRYLFGAINFNSNPYSQAFLQRFAPFAPGEKFDTDKLQTFQENLLTNDYFKTVAIDSKPEEAENLLTPIDVLLSPLPRREYDLGLGFGTNTGARALLNYTARQLSNDGQMFKSQIQASQIYNNAQANYIIPGKNPTTDKYIFGGAIQQTDFTRGKSLLEKASASYTNSVFGLQQILSLALQHEKWSISHQAYQSALLLVPSISWNKTLKDDDITPTKGVRFNLVAQGAPLFSNNTFLQTKLNLKAIYPVWQAGSVITRMDLGHTVMKNPNTLPLSFDFFAGGTDSIRGYAYNSLGPGTNLLTTSLEYRQRIKSDWYLAGFIDAGNASNSFPGSLKKGIGIGPVWQSPVGTLELTLGRGLDTPGKPWLIQFSMGPDL